MRTRRRKTTGDPRAARLDDLTARLIEFTARLIEFTVTVTDEAGRTHASRFRVLTTLLMLDHDTYPATQITQAYTLRRQVETPWSTSTPPPHWTSTPPRSPSPSSCTPPATAGPSTTPPTTRNSITLRTRH
jgi:hypothetical protein